jgi:O-antigen ligase
MSLLQVTSRRRQNVVIPELDATTATDSYRLARSFLFLMSLVTIDAFNWMDRGGAMRYLVLLVPFSTIVWMRLQVPSLYVRAPAGSDLVLGVLCLLGLGGSYVGVAFLGTIDTVRPVFLPMLLGLLYLFTLHEPRDAEVRRTLDWLGLIGLAYVIMNALVNLGVLPGLLQYKQYRNASVAYVALAVAAAFVTGRRRRLLLILVLTAAIFVTYPSATTLLVGLTVVATLFLTGRRATGLRSVVVVGIVILVGVVAVANFQKGVKLSSDYFAAVGKADANAGRLDLWTAGIERWQESPFVGSVFSGEAVAVRSRDDRTLPYHNDFVLFLAEGGLMGEGLLIAFIVLTEITLVRRYRRFIQVGQQDRADLLRIILTVLNAFFMAMLFNPVLPGASRSATIFGLYAIAMSLGDPGKAPASEPDVELDWVLNAPVAPSS